jgi:hypothetical protein
LILDRGSEEDSSEIQFSEISTIVSGGVHAENFHSDSGDRVDDTDRDLLRMVSNVSESGNMNFEENLRMVEGIDSSLEQSLNRFVGRPRKNNWNRKNNSVPNPNQIDFE